MKGCVQGDSLQQQHSPDMLFCASVVTLDKISKPSFFSSFTKKTKGQHFRELFVKKLRSPIISLKLGTKCLVVGSSPSVAKEILKTHDRILSARHVPNAVPSKGSDLDTTSLGWNSGCNSRWRYLRTLCKTELFSAKVLVSQACLREKKVMELVEFLRSKEGEVVNIGES
ncbi:(S)-N-methylcoclaurine 3'-hydroxylase isozyme 1 [Capsicum chinense]|nr:(S)-N-methylcoclaurine 3'-hydroxylase isozyme 1 [Capsicum chinense]